MNTLKTFGWSDVHDQYFQTLDDKELKPARVISIHGFKYLLVGEHGETEAELAGKLIYGSSNEELPKVGDWVAFLDYGDSGYIISVLPRRNSLSRKSAGDTTERQILAANVDYALVVQGLDRDFNIMRLDRYLAQLASCNIPALVLLNKADLVEDERQFLDEIRKLQRDTEVHFCSTLTGKGIEQLRSEMLQPSKTYLLIGSSGVGKSSLLNAISGNALQAVRAVSNVNNKGRHTTTTRDLFRLPNGSLVIDTPGMREFGVTSEEGSGQSSVFPAIDKFASRCRFSDCRHISETGCAVLAALSSGELDPVAYESYIKLIKEQRRFEISAEEKKRLGKQVGKMIREAHEYRKKFKF